MSADTGLRVEFVRGREGPLHLTSFVPSGRKPDAVVVVAQPLAEEASRARRMLALQARRLQAAGGAVLIPDMYGCGDSAGDFREADWETWVEDFRRILELARERIGLAPVVLGLRQGALIVGEALRSCRERAHLVLWQPVAEGKEALAQLLRIRAMAGALGGKRENVAELQAALQAGEFVEVAGYEISPGLASGMQRAVLDPPQERPGRVDWLVVHGHNRPGDEPPSAVSQQLERWKAAGWDARLLQVEGDAFWMTQRIAEVPALLEETTRIIRDSVECHERP